MSIGRVPGATGIQPSIVTAKGDLIVATASGSVTNQAVGSNNQVLTADSAQADGVKWANGSAATLTTTGDLLYASAANTPARLAIGSTDQVLKVSGGVPAWGAAPAPTFVGCVLTNSVGQAITNNTYTAVTFDTESIDTDGFHSTSSNTNRITIPTGKGGKYLFTAMLTWQSNATGYRIGYLTVNSTTPSVSATRFSTQDQGSSTVDSSLVGSIVLNLSAGDWVNFSVYQTSGGNLNVLGNNSDPGITNFTATYLGA